MGWLADLVSLPYNAATGNLTTMQKNALSADEKAQIQSVADGAASMYGTDSAVYQATQESANLQESLADSDVSGLTKSDCAVTLPVVGCIQGWEDFLSKANTAVKIALVVVSLAIAAYFYVVFAPVITPLLKRRK